MGEVPTVDYLASPQTPIQALSIEAFLLRFLLSGWKHQDPGGELGANETLPDVAIAWPEAELHSLCGGYAQL